MFDIGILHLNCIFYLHCHLYLHHISHLCNILRLHYILHYISHLPCILHLHIISHLSYNLNFHDQKLTMNPKGERKKFGGADCWKTTVLKKTPKIGIFPFWTERSPIKTLSSGKRQRGRRLVNIIKTTPHKVFIALHFCTFYGRRGGKRSDGDFSASRAGRNFFSPSLCAHPNK